MGNYKDTKEFLEDISQEISDLSVYLDKNIEVIKQYNINDFEKLKKQTEYNILYMIYLDKEIDKLNKNIKKSNKKIENYMIKFQQKNNETKKIKIFKFILV